MSGFEGTVGAAFGADFATAIAPQFEQMELERMEREAAAAERAARRALAGVRQSSFGMAGPVEEDDAAFAARTRRLVQHARSIRVQVNAVCRKMGRPTTEPMEPHPDDVAAAERPPSYERAQNLLLAASRAIDDHRKRSVPSDPAKLREHNARGQQLQQHYDEALRVRNEVQLATEFAAGAYGPLSAPEPAP